MKALVILLSLAVTTFVAACASDGSGHASNPAASAPRLTRSINLPGVGVPNKPPTVNAIPGRLDHLAYDSVTDRLYLAALEQSSLEVVDLKKGVRLKRVEGLHRPQGIAVVRMAPSSTTDAVVVACGGDGMVRMFDAKTVDEKTSALAGQNADNVRFDGAGRIYVGCGGNEGAGLLAIFDAVTFKRIGEMALPLRPESFQLDPRAGGTRIFANMPGGKTADNDGVIAVIDRAAPVTPTVWKIKDGARNFPLAYDSAHDRIFIACRKPAKVIALDAKTGAVLGESPCVPDSDDLFYDEATNRVYVIGGGRRADDAASPAAPTPGSDAALDVFEVGPKGELTKTASVPTAPHARTGLFVRQRRAVYIAVPPDSGHDAKVLEYTLEH